MKRRWIRRGLRFSVFAALAVTVFSFVVMGLWNWLVPGVFGGHTITFWQALGLLILSKVLFGGFRGRPGPMHWRQRIANRWEQMTPEEREKFRQGMREGCGRFGMPKTEVKVASE
jgi:hypothetical protein